MIPTKLFTTYLMVQMAISTDFFYEEQVSSFCGLHACNNLLQRKGFTPQRMNEVAQDAEQRIEKIVGTKLELHNASGNYGIQVIQQALGLEGLRVDADINGDILASVDNYKGMIDRQDFAGFLMKSENHWWTFQKIGSTWLELNNADPETFEDCQGEHREKNSRN